MDAELARRVLARTDPRVVTYLEDLAKHPTERNACYFVGYIKALTDSKLMTSEDYSFFLTMADYTQVFGAQVSTLIRGMK